MDDKIRLSGKPKVNKQWLEDFKEHVERLKNGRSRDS